jgi:hypothetical protein
MPEIPPSSGSGGIEPSRHATPTGARAGRGTGRPVGERSHGAGGGHAAPVDSVTVSAGAPTGPPVQGGGLSGQPVPSPRTSNAVLYAVIGVLLIAALLWGLRIL